MMYTIAKRMTELDTPSELETLFRSTINPTVHHCKQNMRKVHHMCDSCCNDLWFRILDYYFTDY